MWFTDPTQKPDWSKATAHLSKVDPVMKSVIERVGPCGLKPRRDYFIVLAQSIFTQQISTKVATVLFNRFRDQFPRRKPTPLLAKAFLTSDDEATIRSCGISRQKRGYLIDLCDHFIDRKVPVRRFAKMTDEEVIQSLIPVKGIGRWTAEMFLIFVLNRPDVFPIDDLGLQESYKRLYGLPTRPTAKELLPLGDRWRPWRTIATYYLWRGVEG
jgi:DNA-3-methyladenine glycosylase II